MLDIGNSIELGIYPAENGIPKPIEWLVLQSSENCAKLMSKEAIIKYNKYYYTEDDDHPWKDSELRLLLNSEIFNIIFSAKEKECILESITVDDERVLKEFFWDGKYCESYIGIVKIKPVLTRDYIMLPSMKDLFNYEILPPERVNNRTYEMMYYKLKNDYFRLDKSFERDEPYDPIIYPLIDSVFDGFDNTSIPPKYKRHMTVNSNGFEGDRGVIWLRLCTWIDINKYNDLK